MAGYRLIPVPMHRCAHGCGPFSSLGPSTTLSSLQHPPLSGRKSLEHVNLLFALVPWLSGVIYVAVAGHQPQCGLVCRGEEQ